MNSDKISETKIQPFHDEVHASADNILHYFIIGYFLLGVALSVFYNTWEIGLGAGIIAYGIYYLCRSLLQNKFLFRLVVSFLMWYYPLQFIIQMEGMYEMHFFYFISLTVLLFYEDWRILMPAVVYAIISFLYLFYDQVNGAHYLNNMGDVTNMSAIIHVCILTAYAGICILWSRLQKKQTKGASVHQLQMEQQLQLMDTNISFADSISQGNLKAEYKAQQADRLGESLMNMRSSLIEANEREEREKFVNVGLASIGDILRQNVDHLDELCDHVIEKLVNYMKVNQGGIFIIEKDGEEAYLELKASRAYERKKHLQKRVEIGQGLIGQAAIERRTIYLKEFPEDYINITSGLGLAPPNSLIIVPLKSNDELVGCVELASFKEFSEVDREFLEKVGENIAGTVISAKTNQQTKELLEQSRQMTEEMQSQEEEMRQNMEEMQATQEEMARTQKELSEKEANLNALINNTTDSIITIDRNYKVIIMNNVQKERYKGTQYEGLGEGSNALDMLGDVRDEWKGYYDRAMAGEALNFTLRSTVRGESMWREYSINPIREKTGEIIGASIFSKDISDKKNLEVKMTQKSHLLDAIAQSKTDTYFGIDTQYKIIFANDTLKARFEKSGVQLEEGANILKVLSGDALTTWKERYEKTLQGEQLTIEEDRPVGEAMLKIVTKCIPLRNENEEVVGAAVTSKDITEEVNTKKKINELLAEIAELKK